MYQSDEVTKILNLPSFPLDTSGIILPSGVSGLMLTDSVSRKGAVLSIIMLPVADSTPEETATTLILVRLFIRDADQS
ncbi:MAG: hypothetical protein BWY20_02462 [Spirochaetes bacterium ADurb.Bin215]|nr:MAG: hypothetical protein BWY20_02462 [Spirochaetes bacterium ADurb.Bin215]